MRFMGARLKWLAGLTVFCLLAFLPAGCAFFGAPPAHFPVAVTDEPKIHPGITLKIIVITAGKSEEHVVTVSQAGEVTLPLINAVKCDGLTLLALQEKLKAVHAQFIQNPQITVQFLFGEGMLSPWGTVRVMGKVGREGPVNIPPTCDLTVTRALQLAGGVTPLGNQNRVKITRTTRDGRQCSTEVDVEEIGKRGKIENDLVLQGGDVIWVPEIVW